MIFANRYSQSCIALVVLQQVALAVSTYFIALAGKSLLEQDMAALKINVIGFFTLALLAYSLSSITEWLRVKLKNSLWLQYIGNLFAQLNRGQSYSSDENRERTMSWLGTEAPTTFSELSEFVVEGLSTYCNVIFTLIVFGLTLGGVVTSLMTVSLLISFLLLNIMQGRIVSTAGKMQQSRISTLLQLRNLWRDNFYFDKAAIDKTNTEVQQQAGQYFHHNEKYVLTEQIIACVPIFIALPLVVFSMLSGLSQGSASLGAFVAVLPRTLQLFGNVHTMSMLNSRLVLIKAKLANLKTFAETLTVQDLQQQVKSPNLKIHDHCTGGNLQVTDLIGLIKNTKVQSGRITIMGANGCGKSSLLKWLKSLQPNALLLSPSAAGTTDAALSTGELQYRTIKSLMAQYNGMYLLDEWDANLDDIKTRDLDEAIDTLAEQSLVIEVRHRMSVSALTDYGIV